MTYLKAPVKWERVVPWLHDHELWVFFAPLAWLILSGLASR